MNNIYTVIFCIIFLFTSCGGNEGVNSIEQSAIPDSVASVSGNVNFVSICAEKEILDDSLITPKRVKNLFEDNELLADVWTKKEIIECLTDKVKEAISENSSLDSTEKNMELRKAEANYNDIKNTYNNIIENLRLDIKTAKKFNRNKYERKFKGFGEKISNYNKYTIDCLNKSYVTAGESEMIFDIPSISDLGNLAFDFVLKVYDIAYKNNQEKRMLLVDALKEYPLKKYKELN